MLSFFRLNSTDMNEKIYFTEPVIGVGKIKNLK
jgi:hypothetical protein